MASLIKFEVKGQNRQLISGAPPEDISQVFIIERIAEDFNCEEADIKILTIEEAKAI